MSGKLTQGAFEALFKSSEMDRPVLQLLKLREVPNSSGPSTYRLLMSDGRHHGSLFLLATHLNHLAENNLLLPYCVCRLTRTKITWFSDGRILVIVLDIDILQTAEETGGQIGSPVLYNKEDQTSSPQELASTSTSVPASPPSAAVPGPSAENENKHLPPPGGNVKGFVGNSPSKFSPCKGNAASPGASPMSVPIAYLNPYLSKWTVKARVTSKSNIRTWSNSRGEGRLFSFEIVDESGEIRITAFNNEADTFYSLVEQGKVYYISKGTLKVANKQYCTLKNEYEITLLSDSSIVPCDDGAGVPHVQCNFVPIAELEERDAGTIVDVIGVCKSAEDVSRVVTKTSKEISKRALNLVDPTGKGVVATLWREEAERFDSSGQPVVAIKGARLSDFAGRSVSALYSSAVMVNPEIPEAFRLRAWFDQKGHTLDSQSLTEMTSMTGGAKTNWKALSDVKNEHMGHIEKADYFSCVATLLHTRKDSCLYKGCPSAGCYKKVIDRQDGLYHCEKCNGEFPIFKYRLILSANLADFGDNQWVTCFRDAAEVLLGHSAEALGRLRETDEAAFDEVFQKAKLKTYIFNNRVKLETYNDERRVKVTVMDIQPVNHREYSKRLLDNIRKLAQ
ncbi:replication protein A 70 kDa DNA-binding subunit-like [Brachionichthys hirsutus]|uniref:replication protein A 70 kDa DNA-binding subunit-like n=1 Tax=Brachionichthys hirsutus TaxID=412623 RepID=UPI00360539B8